MKHSIRQILVLVLSFCLIMTSTVPGFATIQNETETNSNAEIQEQIMEEVGGDEYTEEDTEEDEESVDNETEDLEIPLMMLDNSQEAGNNDRPGLLEFAYDHTAIPDSGESSDIWYGGMDDERMLFLVKLDQVAADRKIVLTYELSGGYKFKDEYRTYNENTQSNDVSTISGDAFSKLDNNNTKLTLTFTPGGNNSVHNALTSDGWYGFHKDIDIINTNDGDKTEVKRIGIEIQDASQGGQPELLQLAYNGPNNGDNHSIWCERTTDNEKVFFVDTHMEQPDQTQIVLTCQLNGTDTFCDNYFTYNESTKQNVQTDINSDAFSTLNSGKTLLTLTFSPFADGAVKSALNSERGAFDFYKEVEIIHSAGTENETRDRKRIGIIIQDIDKVGPELVYFTHDLPDSGAKEYIWAAGDDGNRLFFRVKTEKVTGNENIVLTYQLEEGETLTGKYYVDNQGQLEEYEINNVDYSNWDSTNRKLTLTFPLDKTKQIWSALTSKEGLFEFSKEIEVIHSDNNHERKRVELEIRSEGGSSGEQETSLDGIHITSRQLIARLNGWGGDSRDAGYPVSVNWNAPEQQWDISLRKLEKDEWQEVVQNVDIANGIEIEFYIEPLEGASKSYTSYCHMPFKNGKYYGNSAGSILQAASNDKRDISSMGYKRDGLPVTIENETDTQVTLAPDNVPVSAVQYVWYDNNGNAIEVDNGEYVELLKYTITNQETESITVDKAQTLPEKFICKSTNAIISDVSYDSGKLLYTVKEKDLPKVEPFADDINTTIAIPSGEYSGYTLSISRIGNSDKTDLEGTVIKSRIRTNEGYSEFCSGSFMATLTKEGSNTIRYQFSVDVNIVGQDALANNGITPIPRNRVTIDNYYYGETRGYNISYVDPSNNTGELATTWTAGAVDLTGLIDDNGYTRGNCLLITPPQDSRTLTGYKLFNKESAYRFANTNSVAEEIKNEINKSNIRTDYVDSNNKTIRADYVFMPTDFDVDGNTFYTIQREVDEYDASCWCVVEWCYESGNPRYEYLYSMIENKTGGRTQLSIPHNVYGQAKRPMVSKATNGSYEVDVEYYPKSKEKGNKNVEFYRIEAHDQEGKGPSSSKKARVKFEYPNDEIKQKRKDYQIKLKHYLNGVTNEPISEELTFEDDGIIVELSSCSPFLLECVKNDSEIESKIQNPTQEQKDVLDEMNNSSIGKVADPSVKNAVKLADLYQAEGIDSNEVEDVQVGVAMQVKDIVDAEDIDAVKLSMEIHPCATVQLKNSKTQEIGIKNDWLNGSGITIKVPIPAAITKNYAIIKHTKEDNSVETLSSLVKISKNEKYIEIRVTEFSDFDITFTNTNPNPYIAETKNYSSGSSILSYSYSKAAEPKPSTTPIVTTTHGSQMMGTSVISKPQAMLTEVEKAVVLKPGTKASWSKNAYGYYQITDNNGKQIKSSWALVSDELSSAKTGNSSWYYLDSNGHMLTGWQWIKGSDNKWHKYFLNDEAGNLYGACLLGGNKDGKTLNAEGQVVENGVVLSYDTKPVN